MARSASTPRGRRPTPAPLRRVPLTALRIDGERALAGVPLYARLKRLLVDERYRFRVPAAGAGADWNRATFLNLTFFRPGDTADVLVEARLPADVVAHAAWHHLAARALGAAGTTVDGMLLGESIASGFDLYLLGRLLQRRGRSAFVETQVGAIAEVVRSAGLSARGFRGLLDEVARDPDDAFGALQALLYAAATRLARARDTEEGARVAAGLSGARLHPLLHHYNLSNWILSARLHGRRARRDERRVAAVADALGSAPSALDWLDRAWLRPAEAAHQATRTRSPSMGRVSARRVAARALS
jgi:hypothetical protein